MNGAKLYAIVEPDFGARLDLIESDPVWIVKSPVNEPIIRSTRATRPQLDLTGFTYNEKASPEDAFLEELDMIDLHHGPYSANPPYTILQVIGAPLTGKIRTALFELGFTAFNENADGFTALRSLEEARKLRR